MQQNVVVQQKKQVLRENERRSARKLLKWTHGQTDQVICRGHHFAIKKRFKVCTRDITLLKVKLPHEPLCSTLG